MLRLLALIKFMKWVPELSYILDAIISSVKLFKFLSLSRRMSVLWLSLDVALGDIAAFGFALMIIIMGFAFSGQYVYGAHDEEFNTFGKS